MVTLFTEGTKGPCVDAGDTEDIRHSVDLPWLLSLVFTNAGFLGFGNVPE